MAGYTFSASSPRTDSILDLPGDLLFSVCQFLPLTDLVKMREVPFSCRLHTVHDCATTTSLPSPPLGLLRIQGRGGLAQTRRTLGWRSPCRPLARLKELLQHEHHHQVSWTGRALLAAERAETPACVGLGALFVYQPPRRASIVLGARLEECVLPFFGLQSCKVWQCGSNAEASSGVLVL